MVLTSGMAGRTNEPSKKEEKVNLLQFFTIFLEILLNPFFGIGVNQRSESWDF